MTEFNSIRFLTLEHNLLLPCCDQPHGYKEYSHVLGHARYPIPTDPRTAEIYLGGDFTPEMATDDKLRATIKPALVRVANDVPVPPEDLEHFLHIADQQNQDPKAAHFPRPGVLITNVDTINLQHSALNSEREQKEIAAYIEELYI